MSEHTPTTEEMRAFYTAERLDGPHLEGLPQPTVEQAEAEFDRWLAGVVAEEPEWEYGYTSKWGTIAAPSQEDAEARAADHTRGIRENRESGDLNYHGKVMKRIAASKAGPWVPVKQDGETDA